MDRVKANNAGSEWFSHVTDWNAGVIATFGVATDYDTADPSLYGTSVAICEAVMAEVAPEAREDVLARVYGIESSTATKVDGSTKSSQNEEMMAQFSTIYGDNTCGATPPVALKDAVAGLGVPLF